MHVQRNAFLPSRAFPIAAREARKRATKEDKFPVLVEGPEGWDSLVEFDVRARRWRG